MRDKKECEANVAEERCYNENIGKCGGRISTNIKWKDVERQSTSEEYSQTHKPGMRESKRPKSWSSYFEIANRDSKCIERDLPHNEKPHQGFADLVLAAEGKERRDVKGSVANAVEEPASNAGRSPSTGEKPVQMVGNLSQDRRCDADGEHRPWFGAE